MPRISSNSLKLGYRNHIPLRSGPKWGPSMLCQRKLKKNWHNCIWRAFSCLRKSTGWIMSSGKFMATLSKLKITLNSVKSKSTKSLHSKPLPIKLLLSTGSPHKLKADSLSWPKKTTDLPNLFSRSNPSPPEYKPKSNKRSSSRFHQNSKQDLACWSKRTKDSNFNFHQPRNPQTSP